MIEKFLGGHPRIDPKLLRQVAQQLSDSSFCRSTSTSPSVALPESASCNVASVRMSVDLPAPLGPANPNIPGEMCIETLSNAWTPLAYCLHRLLITVAYAALVQKVFNGLVRYSLGNAEYCQGRPAAREPMILWFFAVNCCGDPRLNPSSYGAKAHQDFITPRPDAVVGWPASKLASLCIHVDVTNLTRLGTKQSVYHPRCMRVGKSPCKSTEFEAYLSSPMTLYRWGRKFLDSETKLKQPLWQFN